MSLPSDIKQQIMTNAADPRQHVVFRMPGQDVWHVDGCDGWSVRVATYDDGCEGVPGDTDTQRYLASVASLRELHGQSGGKTVLSRIISGKTKAAIDDVCETYFDRNPGAFCTFVSGAETGMWIVATPELLLHSNGKTVRTMALAGTRPAGMGSPWDSKNIEEQAIVTRFIVEQWRRLGLEPIVGSPRTLVSGSVEHICTDITAELLPAVSIDDILRVTSPTPALCGYPRHQARKLIEKHEAHKRGLYAGYVAVTHGNETTAFAILRCAKITDDGHFAIFAGGGITADSDPTTELAETSLKASALLSSLSHI